ncbi:MULTISPECIES: hypothetical protein [unclassified Pseudomonas]|uniref:hypothetical protein n=1 Tax=unclassified Pseudomonas TaxID=196821 RepID=UPI0024472E74|nr:MULTISPECIES: hypothetical protein [unclassified Pseudomonas]MDG9930345.1 hypothetical protein [Pseudomonas sp. GD04042]MDH0484542.1 hypothetical protein [Pseudomonas sp. GD04015]MDH0606000.1 hypothetical protein [Pseudomonas sp. GD03869]
MRGVLAVLFALSFAVAAGCSVGKGDQQLGLEGGGELGQRTDAQMEAEWLVLAMLGSMRWDWQFKMASELRSWPYTLGQKRILTNASMKPFSKARFVSVLAPLYAERFTAPQLALLRQLYSSAGMSSVGGGVVPGNPIARSMEPALEAAGLTEEDIAEVSSTFMLYWEDRATEALQEIRAAEEAFASGS